MRHKDFQHMIWNFYITAGRHTLPWRKNITPYKIVVSEIMLQQTQVDRVIPFFQKWMRSFPSWKKLATASQAEVLRHWKGLGYNSRALRLHHLAKLITEKYQGKIPQTRDELESLPGIGPYTAGAVMAFAFDTATPIIETNIRRIYIHHFFKNKEGISDKEILEKVERTIPQPPLTPPWQEGEPVPLIPPPCEGGGAEGGGGEKRRGLGGVYTSLVAHWYWALMDYGAYLTKIIPNPNKKSKHYTKQSKFEGSDRQIRGKILEILLDKKSQTFDQMVSNLKEDEERVGKIIEDLEKESFVLIRNAKISLKE
jgi:A/G-specific adenine glycosylase